MGDLSTHFSSREFRCRDGSEHAIDPVLLEMLEQLRSALGGFPIIVTSGYRSPAYNARVGGAPNSYHCRGRAADIQVQTRSPREVYDLALKLFPVSAGIGIYERASGGWVHIDSRQHPARWAG